MKYLTFLFLPVLFVFSCYNSSVHQKNIFHYNEQTGIASLDPAFAKNQSVMWAVHQLYSTLIETDSQLHLLPSLCYRWKVSADQRTYVFYLRDMVFFHDDPCFPGGKGRKLIAKDIVYSFSRLTDSKTASPAHWIFNEKVGENGFTAISDSVFELHLLKPYPPVLGILSMQYCSIVPYEAVVKYGTEFRRHPVGTGPFQFVAWEEGQALIMKRNLHYFEKDGSGHSLPYLDGIQISFYDNKATEFLLFRQKKLDFMNDIDPSFKDEILSKKGTLRKEWMDKIQLKTHPYLNIEYFGILFDTLNPILRNSPLRLKKLRQAINYGFDRKKMVMYLRNGLAIPAESGFVPEGLPSFDSAKVRGYTYQPDKARKLIMESGYGNQPIPSFRILTISIYSDVAGYIAKQLEELGFRIDVEIVQKSLLLDMTSNSKALFFRGSWIADYPDAENYLSVFYSKNPAPPNYTRYNNPEFDRVFEKAIQENNDSLRYDLYRVADRIVIQDAPVVPLWYDEVIHLMQPQVHGLQTNALNLLELRKVRIDPE